MFMQNGTKLIDYHLYNNLFCFCGKRTLSVSEYDRYYPKEKHCFCIKIHKVVVAVVSEAKIL